MKINIAYKGLVYTIEWYADDRGFSDVLEYFTKLSDSRKIKLLYLFRLMGDMGKIMNQEKFRNEGDKIYAFKPSPDRFLCFFFKANKIIITNAFEKKTARLPQREKDRALKRMNEYIDRD